MSKTTIPLEDAAGRLDELLGRVKDKQVLKGMRRALVAGARMAKRIAQEELRATGIHNAKNLGKTIRASAMKKHLGIYVTVNPGKAKGAKGGYYKNRFGEEKPVAMFWARGTQSRAWHTKNKHSTGTIQPHDYMDKAEQRLMDGGLVDKLIDEAAKSLQKIVDSQR